METGSKVFSAVWQATLHSRRVESASIVVSTLPGNDQPHHQRFDPTQTRDDWKTPPKIWRPLSEALGGFDLDPCSSPAADDIAEKRFIENGLKREWTGCVWVNPPFSDIDPWAEKCVTETASGRVETAILLVPDRTDTQWYHKHILRHAEVICVHEGRIQFYGDDGREANAPMGVHFAVFGSTPDSLLEVLNGWGHVIRPEIQTESQTRQVIFDA